MDALHHKIISLHEKVDALYRIVEQIAHQLNLSFSASEMGWNKETRLPSMSPTDLPAIATIPSPPITPNRRVRGHSARTKALETPDEQSDLFHKDVLPDVQGWEQVPDYHTGEQPLSPELQIRRLTAQVTAAYSRIAALEDQLLAQRQPNTAEGSDAPIETRWGRSNQLKS